MLKFSYAIVLVCLQWFQRNSLLKCVSQPEIPTNSLKTILGIQARSRSLMLVPPESSSGAFVMISSKSVSICNRSHARRANSGEMTPSFEDNLVTEHHEICSRETRDSRLSYGKNSESLSHPGLNRYRVVSDGQTDRQTDGRTDRITIANT